MIIPSAKRLEAIPEYYFSQKLVQLKEMEAAGCRVINLGIGNPDQSPPPAALTALCEAALETGSHAYQPYAGTHELRQAMADWYGRVYGVDLEREQVLPLMGSKEGIIHISLAFLDPGDEVLIPDPGYAAYARGAQLAGARPIPYDLTEDGDWLPDLEQLEQRITDRTRILWLNYPHMPTGAAAPAELFDNVLELARRRRLLVCHDNPYSQVLATAEPLSILNASGAASCCLELNSLSKSHNMAGCRVGMVVGDPAYLERILVVKSNMDSGMYLPIQKAAAAALTADEDWHDHRDDTYRQRRLTAWRLMDAMDFHYRTDTGGMFVWARAPRAVEDVDHFLEDLLQRTGVFVTPGRIFGNNGRRYARISLCARVSQLEEATRRVEEYVGVHS